MIRSRSAFYCQPAQHLVIDAGYPMTPVIMKCVIEAAENIVILASSLYGGVRVPEFGLSLINGNYCNILPFIKVRGNYPRIAKSFKYFTDMIRSNEKLSFQEFVDNVKLAIHKILEEYASMQNNQTGLKEKVTSQFVFITIVTLKDGLMLQNCLEEVLSRVSTEKLKKVHILEIKTSTKTYMKRGILIDHTRIPLDNFKLDQFFKHWLLDSDTSHEHIRIHLTHINPKESHLIIKCDIIDSIINPLLLPFGHFYQMQTDYFKGSGVIKFPATFVPVYDLIVKNRISGSGLCESLIFGQPQRLSPTKCWQMEGRDSLKNQQYFFTLCKQLLQNNEYLLAVSSQTEGDISIPGHYVLIPGKHTLLLRAISPSELILPNTSESKDSFVEIPEEITNVINVSFSKLPVIDDLVPETVSSNLYENLKRNLTQKLNIPETQSTKDHSALEYPAVSGHVDHPAVDSSQVKLCLTKKRRLL